MHITGAHCTKLAKERLRLTNPTHAQEGFMNKLPIRLKLALLASFAGVVLLTLTSFLLWQQYQGS